MNQTELKGRTKLFGLDVIRFIQTLPKTETSFVIRRQLLRCATSLGANYRGACRGRSKAEFISKLGTAIEEADESIYWLEMLIDAGMIKADKAGKLIDEANQLVAIFTASHKTASRNNTRRSPAVFNQKSAIRNQQ